MMPTGGFFAEVVMSLCAGCGVGICIRGQAALVIIFPVTAALTGVIIMENAAESQITRTQPYERLPVKRISGMAAQYSRDFLIHIPAGKPVRIHLS